MADIHPTAIVEPGAELGEDVSIGPYCMVGADVVLGDEVRLVSHAVVAGRTSIGPRTSIYPFASIGHPPQDTKYRGEPSRLEIGADNVIREHVTMSPGTPHGRMLTRVGNNCLFMIATHVAHDCIVGDHVVMANNATLGGHVTVDDWAILGGLAGVHQFVRIGRHAIVGGMSGVEHDIIPYGSAMGDRARLTGLNLIGLKRRGFGRDIVHDLRRAFRLLFAQEGTMSERLADVAELFQDNEPVMDIVDFMRLDRERSICQPRGRWWGVASGFLPAEGRCRASSREPRSAKAAMSWSSPSKAKRTRQPAKAFRTVGSGSARLAPFSRRCGGQTAARWCLPVRSAGRLSPPSGRTCAASDSWDALRARRERATTHSSRW